VRGCVPRVSDEVVQVATPVVALKLTVHPARGTPLSVNATLPLRGTVVFPVEGVTVAEKVTDWLTVEGLPLVEDLNVIVPPALFTVCVTKLLLAVKFASPL